MRHSAVLLAVILSLAVGGCAAMPRETVVRANAEPLFVAIPRHEYVWERSVDVLHEYKFEIARESRLDGVIETKYKVGSGLLEPWHGDSVGFSERLESTLQPIRRRVFLHVNPVEGGYLVGVEAFKEIEHLENGVAANSAGGATFQHGRPLRRDLNLVVGQSRPSGWIPLGRDLKLERAMLARLDKAFSRR